MTGGWHPFTYGVIGLGGLGLLGLALSDPAPRTVPAAPTAADAAPELDPATLTVPVAQAPERPELAHYATIVERPLFAPDRTSWSDREAPPEAIVDAPEPEEAPPPMLKLRLLGTVATDGAAMALVQRPDAGIDRLVEGAVVDGWVILEIAASSLTAEHARTGEVTELHLAK